MGSRQALWDTLASTVLVQVCLATCGQCCAVLAQRKVTHVCCTGGSRVTHHHRRCAPVRHPSACLPAALGSSLQSLLISMTCSCLLAPVPAHAALTDSRHTPVSRCTCQGLHPAADRHAAMVTPVSCAAGTHSSGRACLRARCMPPGPTAVVQSSSPSPAFAPSASVPGKCMGAVRALKLCFCGCFYLSTRAAACSPLLDAEPRCMLSLVTIEAWEAEACGVLQAAAWAAA